MRTLTLLTFIILLFSGCKKNSSKNCDEHSVTICSENPAKTNLRIKNNSKYDFCNVVFDPSSGAVNCGIIKQGEMTCYRSFDIAYNYAYIHLYIGDKKFALQPVDYVGEQPLGTGRFTYLLNISEINPGSVSIKVQKD